MSIKSNNLITPNLAVTIALTLTLNVQLRLTVEYRKQADDIQIRQLFCTGFVRHTGVGKINFLAQSHTGIDDYH